MNDPLLAMAFKRRYNRVVTVEREENRKDLNISWRIVKYREWVFIVTEYLKDGITSHVTVMSEGRENRFQTYLEAEVFVADKIGEK